MLFQRFSIAVLFLSIAFKTTLRLYFFPKHALKMLKLVLPVCIEPGFIEHTVRRGFDYVSAITIPQPNS
jgi:hypothetical protein